MMGHIVDSALHDRILYDGMAEKCNTCRNSREVKCMMGRLKE